jgi:hypothetical protein
MLLAGFHPRKEPYLRRKIAAVQKAQLEQIASGKFKLPGSLYLTGVPDPTSTVPVGKVVVIEGGKFCVEQLLIYRSPGTHPGDVRRTQSVMPPQPLLACLEHVAAELQNARRNSAPPSSVLQSNSKRCMQYHTCGVCGRRPVGDRQGATGFWRAVPNAQSRFRMRAKVKHGLFHQETRLPENTGQLYTGQPQVRERQSATDKSSAQGLTLQNSFAVLGNGLVRCPRATPCTHVQMAINAWCNPFPAHVLWRINVAVAGCSLFPLRFLPNPRRAGDQCKVQFVPVENMKPITCLFVLLTFQRVSRGGITFSGVRRA